MRFKGDIIITDPCYICKNGDWSKCGYGDNMGRLGIKNYICRDTIYGDWSCTTFNSDTKEPIGEFCADAGLVAVFLLDEVLKYNPDSHEQDYKFQNMRLQVYPCGNYKVNLELGEEYIIGGTR